MLAPDHHGVTEYLFEQACLLVADRGRTGEQPAHEPARPADADNPAQPQTRGWLPGLGRHLGHQLNPERSLRLLAPAARREHFGGDLAPDVVPQRASACRGERLDLQLALPVPDRYPDAVLLGLDELDLVLGADRHLQAAEVNPLLIGVGLLRVPGASLRPRGPRGRRG